MEWTYKGEYEYQFDPGTFQQWEHKTPECFVLQIFKHTNIPVPQKDTLQLEYKDQYSCTIGINSTLIYQEHLFNSFEEAESRIKQKIKQTNQS